MNDFYVVSASENDGISLFFEEEWNPALPEFNQVVKNPELGEFADSYEMKADLERFEVDVVLEQYIASSEFVRMCESQNCSFIDLPLKIVLLGGAETEKEYRFFCVLSRCSLLDSENSVFTLMDERLLRPSEEREGMSPVYDRIDRFVPRKGVSENLFYCEELKQVVCSSLFKADYDEKGLVGLEFQKIDDDFVYAPWG
jgi:hypothetical protein